MCMAKNKTEKLGFLAFDNSVHPKELGNQETWDYSSQHSRVCVLVS